MRYTPPVESHLRLSRRKFLLASTALIAMSTASRAHSQYPSRPINIITPFAPGSSDLIARRLGEHASRQLKQPFVVETRPGAQGIIASRSVVGASNDGYTLLLGTNSTHAASPYLFKSPGYNPVTDFTPITLFTINPLLLVVHADLPVYTVRDFVKYVQRPPRPLNFGAGNTGSLVAAQLVKQQIGFEAEAISYAGNAQAAQDFVAGRLDFMVTDPMIVKPYLEAGRLRVLGVTSRQRLGSMPDIVPLAEQGLPDYEYASWIGLFGPSGMSPDITTALHQAFREALLLSENQDFLNGIGMIPADLTPEQFGAFVQDQINTWGQLTQLAGLTPQ